MSMGSRMSACWMMKTTRLSVSGGSSEMKFQVAAPQGFVTGNTNRIKSAEGRKRAVISWWLWTMELVPGVSMRLKSRRKAIGR